MPFKISYAPQNFSCPSKQNSTHFSPIGVTISRYPGVDSELFDMSLVIDQRT